MNPPAPRTYRIAPIALAILMAASALSPLATAQTAPTTPSAPAPGPAQQLLQSAQNASGLVFERNLGQWNSQALFRVHAAGYDTFITRTGFAMVQIQVPPHQPKTATNPHPMPTGNVSRWATLMNLAGSNPAPIVTTDGELAYHTNYFIGNNPLNWHPNIPTYHQVTLSAVYPGIDLVYHPGKNGSLEYDFIIHPGADPNQIQQRFTGQTSLTTNSDGSLTIQTGLGAIRMDAPSTKQADGTPVSNRYTLANGVVSFAVGTRNPTQDLVIDPAFYSTYLGGNGEDDGYAIAADSSGNAYVTGYVDSSNYPTTSGAYQTAFGGDVDAVVTKLNSAGSALAYSTYLGGNQQDVGYGIAVDSSGDIYLTGEAGAGYPTTSGAKQTTNHAGDAFVTKLNPSGSSLIYSTFVGGSSAEFGFAIAVDASGDAYITGYTDSTDFPTSASPYQATNAGTQAIFVTEVNPTGSNWVYSTYLGGGADNEIGYGIGVDSSGNAYVTGDAKAGFPTTSGAYQTTNAGGYDVFVTKINSGGGSLGYSTFIGGTSSDIGYAIAVDSSGNAYVTGYTGADFPTTTGGHYGSIFVAKFTSSGGLTYATGICCGYSHGIAVDSSGNAYIAGYTSSSYPTTSGAYQTSHLGPSYTYDAVITKLNSAGAGGSSLLASTYLGGSDDDYGQAIALSGNNAYVAGTTWSTDFPIISGSYQTTNAGYGDFFVRKIPSIPPNSPTSLGPSCGSPNGVSLTWTAPSSGPTPESYNLYRSSDGTTFTLAGTSTTTTYRDVPPYRAAAYTYRVTSANLMGESSPSTTSLATCDPNPPTITGNPHAIAWTNSVSLTGVSWSDDYSGFQANAQYSVGTTAGGTDVSGGWTTMPVQPTAASLSWTPPGWSPATLAQGTNHINTRVTDRAGNVLTTNDAYTVQYDNVAESITGLLARIGAAGSLILDSTWQSINTPRFAWTAPTSTSPEGYSYTLSTSSSATPDSTSDTSNAYVDLSGSPLADGIWHFKVRAVDAAGNVGPIAGPFSAWVDATPPTLPAVSSPTHPSQTAYYNQTSATLNWASSDATSGVAGYYYTAPASSSSSCPLSLTHGTWTTATTATFTGLGPFWSYVFCVQAKDNAGNLGPVASYTFHVNTLPPTIQSPTPANGSTQFSPQQPIVVTYDDKKGGQDPMQAATRVDPLLTQLFVDGTDVVAQYRTSAECMPVNGQVPPTCPIQVDGSHVQYTPPTPWLSGLHSLGINIGDTTIPPVHASLAWNFTEVQPAELCPAGTTGATIAGRPQCTPTPCQQPIDPNTASACGNTVCPNGLTTSPTGTQVAVVCGQPILDPCPVPMGPPGPDQLAVLCGQPLANPCPQGVDVNTTSACGVLPGGLVALCPAGHVGAIINGAPACLVLVAPCPPGSLGAQAANTTTCLTVPLAPCPNNAVGATVNGAPLCIPVCPNSPNTITLGACIPTLTTCPTGFAGVQVNGLMTPFNCLNSCPLGPGLACIPSAVVLDSCPAGLIGEVVNGVPFCIAPTPVSIQECPSGEGVIVNNQAACTPIPGG